MPDNKEFGYAWRTIIAFSLGLNREGEWHEAMLYRTIPE
jgi:hypothetical protein